MTRNYNKKTCAVARVFVSFLLLAVLPHVLSPQVSIAFDATSRHIRRLISEELIYPRECRYSLPASLPDAKSSRTANDEFAAVAYASQKAGIVDVYSEGGTVKIVPRENTSNFIQQITNLRYEIVGLSLILGTWDVAVDQIAQKGNKVTALGKKELKKPSAIYSAVMNALSSQERGKYSTMPMSWELIIENNHVEIVEKQMKP